MNSRSLVLITVDCLRADCVGFRGYTQPLTPFLESLAKESIVFSDAIVAGAPTYFSFPVIMASRYPLALGREVMGIAPGEATMATTLQETGYETGAFIAGNPYLSMRFGYDQGFRQFSDFLDSGLSATTVNWLPPASTGWSRLNRVLERLSRRTKATAAAYDELYFRYCQWRSGHGNFSMDQLRRYPAADVVVNAACAWLKNLGSQPFFLWIHLMDPHHPYYPPQEALQSLGISHITPQRARFLNAFWNRGDVSPKRLQRYRKEVMGLYDAGVHWVDQQLSRLASALKARQRWNDTVFVVTADHGEEFLEHGSRYHSPNGLAESLIRVPLLVRSPNVSTPGIVPGPFSLLHLAPTLLEALGVDVPLSFRGRGLWKDISSGSAASHPAIIECVEGCNNPLSMADRLSHRLMAVRDGDYKLVLRFGDSAEELYSLKDDPEERLPLPAGIETKERVRLLQRAREHLRDSREHRDAGLALRSRLREIRQLIELKSLPLGHSRNQSAAEIEEHG
jgi:arylsulfatase A-like enzyme